MGPLLFDQEMVTAVQLWNAPWLTAAMKAVSSVFQPAVLSGALCLLVIVVFARRRSIRGVFLLLLAAGNTLPFLVKILFERPRPSVSQAMLFVHERGFGFPSGHATGIVLFCAGVLLLFQYHHRSTRQWYVATAILLTLLVGYSRVYLGVHWPTDVLGGYVLAAVWIVIARWLVKICANHRPSTTL